MAKTITSRPSIFGWTNHYDEHGKKIGESRPSIFGGVNHYDASGKKVGHSYPGIISDDGQSGTSFHRREAFNRMIQDCREGKINMILTKSISRFARNTVDSIKFIRELKSLGIGVMFEKENIWSLDSKGESVPTDLIQNHYRPLGEKPLLYNWVHSGFIV